MRNTDKLGLVVPTNKATENFSTQNYVNNFDKIDNFAAATDSQLAEKALKTEVGTLASLLTTTKTSIVNAINELFNNKANKAQEAWITPTLLNGAVAESGFPIQYRVNSIGQLEFKGRLNTTGLGQGIQSMILVNQARPTVAKSFAQSNLNTNGASRMVINTNGAVTFVGYTLGNVIDLNLVTSLD